MVMKLPRLQSKLQAMTPKAPRPIKQVSDSWRDGRSSTQRGYGYKWQKARERFLSLNPLCVYCERNNRVTVATVVDHITPHKGDQAIFWDEGQWQSLCASCHSSTKQREEKQQFR